MRRSADFSAYRSLTHGKRVRSRAMSYQLTGVSTPFGGASWTKVPGDEDVARAVISFLEDRRLLFGQRHMEDERYCVESAIQARKFLTEQITYSRPGKELERCLKGMRAAFRLFVERGGPNGQNFIGESHYEAGNSFGLFLGDLRTSIGFYLAEVLANYPQEIERTLASILPPPDS